MQRGFQQSRQSGFTNPAKGQRRHGYAQLSGRNIGIEVIEKTQQEFGTTIAGLSQCDNTGTADRNKGKFGRNEKTIGNNQQNN
jgi:hypothetical protein